MNSKVTYRIDSDPLPLYIPNLGRKQTKLKQDHSPQYSASSSNERMSDSLAIILFHHEREDPSLDRAILAIDPCLFTDEAYLGISGLTV